MTCGTLNPSSNNVTLVVILWLRLHITTFLRPCLSMVKYFRSVLDIPGCAFRPSHLKYPETFHYHFFSEVTDWADIVERWTSFR